MAVEDVRLAALPVATPGGAAIAHGKSGYHGSFVLRLLPGHYRIEGRGGLPQRGGPDRVLTGHVVIEVPDGAARIDRVILKLREDR
jgi:hypothetical protein